jgi:hypothetical protein
MKIDREILMQIRHDYALHRKLSAPYLQRKWRLTREMADEVVKYLTIGMK